MSESEERAKVVRPYVVQQLLYETVKSKAFEWQISQTSWENYANLKTTGNACFL